jgi:hypothetical protein
MAIERAQERLEGADIRPYTVNSGQTVRKGFAVKTSGAGIVEAAAVGDNAIGIALDLGDGNGTTGPTSIRVAHFGKGVVKALVGTGAATKGSFAKFVSDGATDATVGGATTKLVVYGQWLEAGAAGEVAGLNLGMAAPTVGS